MEPEAQVLLSHLHFPSPWPCCLSTQQACSAKPCGVPLRLRLQDPLPFIRNELSALSVVFLLQQGERDLPEVSRRDLDLLIAEEDEAILKEQGRPIWQCGVCPVLG